VLICWFILYVSISRIDAMEAASMAEREWYAVPLFVVLAAVVLALVCESAWGPNADRRAKILVTV
jgi:hypothetical protein